MKANTLVELIDGIWTRDDLLLYSFLDRSLEIRARLTAADLHTRSKVLASYWQRQFPAGSRVLLFSEQEPDYILALFSALLAGLVPVTIPVPTAASAGQWMGTLGALRVHGILGPKRLVERLPMQGQAYPVFTLEDAETLGRANTWRHPRRSASEVALIQMSSGTTAVAKPILLSHTNILANLAAIVRDMQIRSDDVALSWLPFHHDMGLIGHVFLPMYARYPSIFMSARQFSARPWRWLEAISRYRATISGAPEFAFRLCLNTLTEDKAEALDLRHWRVCYSGAERINPDTMRGFHARLRDSGLADGNLFPCYGMAESTLYVCGRFGLNTVHANDVEHVSVGSPSAEVSLGFSGLEADQQNEHGAPVAHGEILLHSPSISVASMVPEPSGRPVLRTGDTGFLSNGELYVTGRKPDRLKLRGASFHAGDMEQCLYSALGQRGMRRVLCLPEPGCSDGGLVVLIEARLPRSRALSLLHCAHDQLLHQFRIRAAELRVLHPGSLGRTSSGKLQRSRCLAMLEAGRFNDCTRVQLSDREQGCVV